MWIEVFELTAEQEEQDWYDLAECNIVSRFFLTMDSFSKYTDVNGYEYVSFYSGGCEWISILKLDEFLELYINKTPWSQDKEPTTTYYVDKKRRKE